MSQGDLQASIRAVTGTALDFNGDWLALFDQAGIAAGTFNGRMLAWLNAQMGASYADLPGAQAAYAAERGATTWSAIDAIGAGSQPATAPTVAAVGTYAASATSIDLALPVGWQQDDIFVLFVESANSAVTLPVGWTRFAADNGTGSSGGAVLVTAAWKRATASESGIAIASPIDHVSGVILAVRGCITTGNPFEAVDTTIRGVTVTNVEFPDVTTLGDNRLILSALVDSIDATATNFTLGANANLTGLATVLSQQTDVGHGGGLHIVSGVKATAGAVGFTTATLAVASTQSRITIAMVPA